MSIKIYFDMDGTVYDLYALPNWLQLLQSESTDAFTQGKPMFRDEFYDVVSALLAKGVSFGVITWLPMQASDEYAQACEKVKREWCKKFLPFISTFQAQPYGVPKQNAIEKHASTEFLLDDNEEVGAMWETPKQRVHIKVSHKYDVTKALKGILNYIMGE